VALGTNTDPYQRAEGRYRLMPGIIAALAGSGTPFSILTKGTTARRDLPLLTVASTAVPVSMGVSIALTDETIHAALEPGTPTPRARLDLVRAIVDAGLPCQVLVAPILPMITDSDEQLDTTLSEIAAAGATGATVFRAASASRCARVVHALPLQIPAELVDAYAELYRKGSYVTRSHANDLAERSSVLLRATAWTARTPCADPRHAGGTDPAAPGAH
jgi:DNA repair photolyase